jgi:hypothetical protein
MNPCDEVKIPDEVRWVLMSRPGVQDLSIVLLTPERNSCSCSKKVISWFFSFSGCNKLVVMVLFSTMAAKVINWTSIFVESKS